MLWPEARNTGRKLGSGSKVKFAKTTRVVVSAQFGTAVVASVPLLNGLQG